MLAVIALVVLGIVIGVVAHDHILAAIDKVKALVSK